MTPEQLIARELRAQAEAMNNGAARQVEQSPGEVAPITGTAGSIPAAAPPSVALPVSFPKTPAQVRSFVGHQFASLRYGREDESPDIDDLYTMTAHDIISAFDWWFGRNPLDFGDVSLHPDNMGKP